MNTSKKESLVVGLITAAILVGLGVGFGYQTGPEPESKNPPAFLVKLGAPLPVCELPSCK